MSKYSIHSALYRSYECEILCLILREKHRHRVFENRFLRRIFGPKRDEVTVDWRKLHNEELHSLYSSPSIIRMVKLRRLRWSGHVAQIEAEEEKDCNPHTHCVRTSDLIRIIAFLVVFVDVKSPSLRN
jgi:hypothetical protein